MRATEVYVWGSICPPRQEAMDWYVIRGFGNGGWLYQVTPDMITNVLQACDGALPERVPYVGANGIEIP